MRKVLAIMLCLLLFVSGFCACFAETVVVESGEIKAGVSDLGTTADFLFKTNQNRALSVVMFLFDLSDALGNGPLDASKVLSPLKYTCWIGITNNNKNLVVISLYDDNKSIIAIDYNPKGIIKYYIYEKSFASEEKLLNYLPELFSAYNVAEYYEVLPDEILSTFSSLGINITVDANE